jgi:hypothetical protein
MTSVTEVLIIVMGKDKKGNMSMLANHHFPIDSKKDETFTMKSWRNFEKKWDKKLKKWRFRPQGLCFHEIRVTQSNPNKPKWI